MYPGGIVYARLGDLDIAHYHASSGPTLIRWFHLDWTDPSYMVECESVTAAQTLIAQWVAGLDIERWDE